VVIQVEKRQGNKAVTRAWGFKAYGIDAAAVRTTAAKRFACSVVVQTSSDSTGGGGGGVGNKELIVQGTKRDELCELLCLPVARGGFGVPREVVTTLKPGKVKGAKGGGNARPKSTR
jgi:translation initiation factor 1 (eIF-1/SUI1)